MREIDPDALEPLAHKDFGPWRLGDDRIVKSSYRGNPLRTEEDAQALFDTYRTVYDTGASSPRPFDIVRMGDAFGVVLEYVRGLALTTHLIFGSYSPEEAGQAMGTFMRRLHGIVCHTGHNVNEEFIRNARSLAPLLPSHIGDRLVSLVEAIPNPHALLHGDLHPGNVVVLGDKLTAIDMELSGFGHPVFDIACTRTRLLLNSDPLAIDGIDPTGKPVGGLNEITARAIWDSFVAAYLAGAMPVGIEELDRRTAVLAEVDHCCYKFGIGRPGNKALTAGQQRRLGLCAERLAILLPVIVRLDLEA